MSVLISFDQCVARPEEKDEAHLLVNHLRRVKKFVLDFVDSDDPVIMDLVGLAALCHDIAKAHPDWQHYINGKQKKGPAHAPAGAFLFSYLSYHWLKDEGYWQEEGYRIVWIWLIRDIADHHGRLKNQFDLRWIGTGQWGKMDLGRIARFFCDEYPYLKAYPISEEALDEWMMELDDVLEDVEEVLDLGYEQPELRRLMDGLQRWRDMTTALIGGDRFDVTPVETLWIASDVWKKIDKSIDLYTSQQRAHPMAAVRQRAQQEVMARLKQGGSARFYTLEMPTGYGKTITALKIASWLGTEWQYRKIVYVAPYLSILEQTSDVMEKAMHIQVLEHHSLAVLEKGNGRHADSELEQRAPTEQLAMESWAHSVVCTSFQQLTKAVFPGRAQDVLRRVFLRDSILIIDEPQIFNPERWNLFLCGLESLADSYNLCVIFLSATMPPFHFGLQDRPIRLKIAQVAKTERYQVELREKMDEEKLAAFMAKSSYFSQAAILNTIKDAYLVYQEMTRGTHHIKGHIHLVHGLMIPIHKKIAISKMQHRLKQINSGNKDYPLFVVSTQVIEAGVDVSFQHVVRALPIMPSIAQAAGRVNRHAQGEKGILSVVPFYRSGEKDTRMAIYHKDLRRITDQILFEKQVWTESEMHDLVNRYYEVMFRENTYETSKEAIRDAYEGEWEKLGKFQPFSHDFWRLPIFVPWNVSEEDARFVPPYLLTLLKEFQVSSTEEIYDRYQDKPWIDHLSFEQRKRFMILFHHFVLNVPVDLALQLSGKEEYLRQRIPLLQVTGAYDHDTGLTGHFIEGYDQFI